MPDIGAASDAETPSVPLTVAEWLDRVTPTPPPALRVRLVELLAPHAARPAGDAAAACLEAGEAQLAIMLSSQATDRGSALDLLAVDALVTYAFEAACEAPAALERLANDAMTRIAEIPEAT